MHSWNNNYAFAGHAFVTRNSSQITRRSLPGAWTAGHETSRTLELEPFHLNVDTQNNSRKAPKSTQKQEDRHWHRKRQSPTCCRDSGPKERKVEKAEGERPCQTRYSSASERQATLQRLLYSRKVRERRETKPPRREKRRHSG